MQTITTVVGNPGLALALVAKLVAMSQWFQFEPMPGDSFEITVKKEIGHLLAVPCDTEIVERLATYEEGTGAFLDTVPLLEVHLVVSDEKLILDLAKPDTPWQEGSQLFLERRPDHWRCTARTDQVTPAALIRIGDDGTFNVEQL